MSGAMALSERQLVSFLGERFSWPAPDVTLGIGDDQTKRWKAFGAPRALAGITTAPPAVLGWSLVSPLLAMQGFVRCSREAFREAWRRQDAQAFARMHAATVMVHAPQG